jgi:sigma-B regulation protein RsbU (phosphoserine phosphatase)
MTTTALSLSNPAQLEAFLLEVAEAVNTTLELDQLLKRVAELVRRVIDYEIFTVMLLDKRAQELRVRFAIGYPEGSVPNFRTRVGQGVTGQAAARREPVLVNEASQTDFYIAAVPGVHSELAVPLIVKNEVIGVINLEAAQPGYFTEEHRRLVSLVASRVAVSVVNARLYTRLARQARSLKLLNEIARNLSSILNLDELLRRTAEQLQRLTDYQLFSVLLLDESGTKLEHRFSQRSGESIHIKRDIPLGQGLVGYAARHNQPVLVPDVSRDGRYINLNPETRAELVVPLVYQDKVIGVLDLEHTVRAYFSEEHVRTLTTLAAQIAIAIENARLYETVTRQERQLASDLDLARELQNRLLPPRRPRLRAAEISAHFCPARFVGGDLYDFVPYSRERMGVAVGDVSGKGAPAAIYAALGSGFLRSHAAAELGPAKLLAAVNRSLAERPIAAHYLSMIFALWDDRRGRLTISNSGLPQPIYCRQGGMEKVPVAGLPLGLFGNAQYDELVYRPKPGELFVFFSDGLTDASNPEGQMFGRSRLEAVVAGNRTRSAEEIIRAIVDAVTAFTAGAAPWDDQTIVALKIRASKARPRIG